MKPKTKKLSLPDAAKKMVLALDNHLNRFPPAERLARTKKALARVRSKAGTGGARSTPGEQSYTRQIALAARSRR